MLLRYRFNLLIGCSLILSVMFITFSAMAENTRNVSFDHVKRDLKNFVYYDHPETFYCHIHFDGHNKVELPEDFDAPKYKNRANRMEWEHIVPSENFGRAFKEWREGHPDCVNSKGGSYKGRRCAYKTNIQFRIMQSDMYNLYPSVGSVNAIRSNYNFAELSGENDIYIEPCDFKVQGRKVEPANFSKGEIARTYLYFDSEYPSYNMSKQSKRQMNVWNSEYPVTSWECTRAKRIEKIQGNPNKFVKEPCIEKGWYNDTKSQKGIEP